VKGKSPDNLGIPATECHVTHLLISAFTCHSTRTLIVMSKFFHTQRNFGHPVTTCDHLCTLLVYISKLLSDGVKKFQIVFLLNVRKFLKYKMPFSSNRKAKTIMQEHWILIIVI
jgi:hypothetical protein